MFREHSTEGGKYYRLAVIALLILSAAGLAITIWVELDFLHEQDLLEELLSEGLPRETMASVEELSGELRWQFRLITLVGLNLLVTGFAIALLWRAYSGSQESLRDFKALAGDILSSMNQGVITTDTTGRVTSINRRGQQLLTLDDEFLGYHLSEVSQSVPLETFRQDWIVEKSAAMTQDFSAKVHGTDRILRTFCQTLNDIEDQEIGFVLQIRDVTNRVLIEERMRRMERYMGLGSLAAGLHHEIKNPLTALSLHIQLLEEELESFETNAEIRQLLGVITTEITRVGGVLEGFRDFAAIGQLCPAPVKLMDLVRRQVDLITPQANQAKIHVNLARETEQLPIVLADEGRLEQVLLNLLVNAIESMPNGGQLSITMHADAEHASVEITDTGSGIPEDLRDKIFDPYFTTKSTGTGLGLALCDKIIRQHNGNLEFHSTPEGTTFQVVLPLAQPADSTL